MPAASICMGVSKTRLDVVARVADVRLAGAIDGKRTRAPRVGVDGLREPACWTANGVIEYAVSITDVGQTGRIQCQADAGTGRCVHGLCLPRPRGGLSSCICKPQVVLVGDMRLVVLIERQRDECCPAGGELGVNRLDAPGLSLAGGVKQPFHVRVVIANMGLAI